MNIKDRILGCQIGGAVGDALGAPMECLHYLDIRQIFTRKVNYEKQ